MDLRAGLRRLSAAAPVPVFPVVGAGFRWAVQDLRPRSGIRLVDTPRAASILLVAGDLGVEHDAALAAIHDLLPHPRATIVWRTSRLPEMRQAVDAIEVSDKDPEPRIRAIFAALVTEQRPSEPPVLPDVDPVLWRGQGPYGQGGTGMTGGTPFGRPLAEVGPDRDGLRLDVLPVEIGPFFPRLPTGLILEARLAGDVLVEVDVPSLGAPLSRPAVPQSPFVRALTEPVPIRELEVARARDHLRWLADALIAQGLPAFGLRALRLAQRAGPGDGDHVRRFDRDLRWTQLFRWSLPPAAAIDRSLIRGEGLGPLARAAGLVEDVRLDEPAYRHLGFAPIVLDENDPAARWHLRLAEAGRSLDLAAIAADRMTERVGVVESPRGRLEPGNAPTARALRLVPGLLSGLEWGDAIAALISLDLDLDEASQAAGLAGRAAA